MAISVFFLLKLWRFCRILFNFSPKNILCRIRTTFDAKWQNFIPRKNSGLVKRVLCGNGYLLPCQIWFYAGMQNNHLTTKIKHITFLRRNGRLLPCQFWFYARMVAFSPVKIQLFARMAIFLHCQISSLSASLGHFPTSGLTGSRILCPNVYLLPRFYVGMIIFSPIKFNSMTETSSLSAVEVQGSLSHILHLSDIPRPID